MAAILNISDLENAKFNADGSVKVALYGPGGAVLLPAAAALADATANPTTSAIASMGMGFNGTTWDRLRTKGTGWQGVSLVRSTDAFEIFQAVASSGDAASSTTVPIMLARAQLYNGASADMQRNTVEATLLASAARTTTQTSADITTYNARNLQVVLDMTVVGTGSVTVTINGKDSASGKYLLLLSGVAIVTNITSRYKVGPDIATVANVIAQDYLPRFVQIVVTANNANSATYSVGYILGV